MHNERGQTYPEMDKLLSLCKIFNCSLDELTNDDIKEISKNEKSQSTISNSVSEVLDVLSRSIVLFESMTPKNRMKMIFELIILILILCCFRLPVDYINYLGEGIFLNLDQMGDILCPIWNFVLYTSYIIFMFICFYYLYKGLFLERLENIKEEEAEADEHVIEDIALENKKDLVVEVSSNEEEKTSNAKHKKQIRNHELKKERKFSSTILKELISLGTLFVKVCLVCFMVPFLFFFVLLIVFSIIDVYLILFEKFYFFGILPLIISGIMISYLAVKILFNVVVDRKNPMSFIFKVFIISLIILGVGAGISIIEFSTIDFDSKLPDSITSRYSLKTVEREIPMNDNLHFSIDGYYEYEDIRYIEDENKTDTVLFEVAFYEDFQDVSIRFHEEQNLWIEQDYYFDSSNSKTRKLVLDSLRNKKFYDYNLFETMYITVITSSENIEKIKASNEKMVLEERKRWKEAREQEILEYQNLLDKKDIEIDRLNTKIDEQEYEINDYKEQIEQYKEDLENYKEEIKNQIQGIISE